MLQVSWEPMMCFPTKHMSKPAVKEAAAPPKAKKVAQVICDLCAHSFHTDN